MQDLKPTSKQQSLLMYERGLKYFTDCYLFASFVVAPHAGARIEIEKLVSRFGDHLVATHSESRIEIQVTYIHTTRLKSHLMQERGLKVALIVN